MFLFDWCFLVVDSFINGNSLQKKKISKLLNNQNSPNFFTTLNAHLISFLLSQNMQTYKMCTILLINIITIIKHKKQPNVTSIYSIMSCS